MLEQLEDERAEQASPQGPGATDHQHDERLRRLLEAYTVETHHACVDRHDRTANSRNDAGKAVKASRIHVMGVAYKRDIDDMRESPAVDIMLLLQKRGAILSYSDPHVPKLRIDALRLESLPEAAAADADCVVIVTDHAAFDYDALLTRASLIVDSRNALKGRRSEKIVRL